jgi:hypothetical protein
LLGSWVGSILTLQPTTWYKRIAKSKTKWVWASGRSDTWIKYCLIFGSH